jgi:hypothetical protein
MRTFEITTLNQDNSIPYLIDEAGRKIVINSYRYPLFCGAPVIPERLFKTVPPIGKEPVVIVKTVFSAVPTNIVFGIYAPGELPDSLHLPTPELWYMTKQTAIKYGCY